MPSNEKLQAVSIGRLGEYDTLLKNWVDEQVVANPVDTATSELEKIKIGDTVYEMGSSGHIIEDANGTDMTARGNLQFTGAASVSDDSTNDRTIVNIPIMPATDISEILNPLPTPNIINVNDLGDVQISNVNDGQVLTYDSSNAKWVNEDASGGTTVVANPTGSATDDLTKLQVGEDIYSIDTGTSVEANPTGSATDTLTKLEVEGTIYGIPEIDDINDLSNVDASSATNNQILRYDSTNSKWINSTEEVGTTVVANPVGTSSTDLTKLQVENNIYNIPQPIDVVANPEGTATSDLSKIQIDSTIYDLKAGHVIENASGTDMTLRTNLQFKGAATVSDDSTNDRTIVEVPVMPAVDISEILDPLPTPNIINLGDLGDVNVSSVSDGQTIKWDSTSSQWINAEGGGVSSLDDLTDTNISVSLSDGQLLKYNSTSSKWEDSELHITYQETTSGGDTIKTFTFS